MGEKELLSRREVADRLGVSVQTVGRLVDAGSLNGVRIGPRAIRVTAESVIRFVKARTMGKGKSNSEVSSEQ